MSSSLLDFIADIREAETPDEQRLIIRSELADMRTMIREIDTDSKPRLVSKLVYLNIFGENVSWGQVESVSLMAHERFSYKRVGYLAAQTLLDESSDVAVLITQTILQDLKSQNPLVASLALSYIANKGTEELCEASAPDVDKLTGSIHPGVCKRAGAAAVTILRRRPDLAKSFKKALNRLLTSTKHGVVSSGVLLAMEMIKSDPSLHEEWSHFSRPFAKLLRDLISSKPSPEFRHSIFNDPFLQIKTMQLLGILAQPSDSLDDTLTNLVTSIDVKRNTGRAILFQAVETIGLAAKKPSLAGLALNQIGRLLNSRETNVLYSAMAAFARLLYNGAEVINRNSRESLALQRYKTQVVHCLDHRDPSIRRRALDVVLALVDDNNVETLIPEVIDYLKLADRDFRFEMVSKIYASITRFAPTLIWHFDTALNIILDSGPYVGPELIINLCRLVSSDEEVRNHALPILSNTLAGFCENQSLICVASFALGEFAGNAGDAKVLMRIIKMPQTEIETKAYVITAMAKIAARLSCMPSDNNENSNILNDVKELLGELKLDSNIEVQQRAGELINILAHPELWPVTFAPPNYNPLPPRASLTDNKKDIKKDKKHHHHHHKNKEKASLVNNNDDKNSSNILDISEITSKQQQDTVDDLLDFGLDTPSTNSTNVSSTLAELTNALYSNNDNSNNNAQSSLAQDLSFKPPPGAVEALKTADFAIYFEIQKNASNPNQIAIRATIANLCAQPLTQFSIQYGVPSGWFLRTQPIKNAVLQARGGLPLQHVLFLENKGNAPLMMKTHTTYMFGAQPLTSDDTLNPIFSSI